jgi:protein involved in polysaccharide export with SLBB domain
MDIPNRTNAKINNTAPKLMARVAYYAAALSLLLIFQPDANAQNGYEPIADNLAYLQKQRQLNSAPAGTDEMLSTPTTPLQVDSYFLANPESQSAITAKAESYTDAVTLADDQADQIVKGDLQQFGYNIFNSSPTTFAQVDDIPVPPDYIIGPGDNLVVQLFGKLNVQYDLTVTREGTLLIPELGPITVSGQTFAEIKTKMVKLFDEQVIGATASVSMGRLRTIKVRLAGEFKKPGVYTVSALGSLVDSILSAGGIAYSGSLRNIKVKRRGKTVANLDLYDLLMRGDAHSDIRLQHNDVIFVPSIGTTVYIGGEVQRPGIYELKSESNVSQALTLAGGALPSADLASSHIERIANRSYHTLIDFKQTGTSVTNLASIKLQAGDFIKVLPVIQTMDDVVLLSGHVKRPGGYELTDGLRVSTVVTNRRQLLPETDLDFALLIREQEGTRRTQIEFLDLGAIIRQPGSENDRLLRPRDELMLFGLDADRASQLSSLVNELDRQKTDYQASQTASVLGFSRHTGRFPLAKDVRLLDFIKIAGGLKAGIDTSYAVVASKSGLDGYVAMRSINIGAAIADQSSDQNPIIKAGDKLYLFDKYLDRSALMQNDLDKVKNQTTYTADEQLVQLNGLVAHPGTYPLDIAMRASDLVCAGGGLRESAFGLEAELSRYSVIDGEQRSLEHIRLSASSLARICEQKRQHGKGLQHRKSADKNTKHGELVSINGEQRVVNIIEPIRFNSGDSAVNSAKIELLKAAFSEYKTNNNNVSMLVSGYTDATPLSPTTAERFIDNEGLSQHRAEIVATKLQELLGFSQDQFVIRGLGASNPIASNDSAQGRALNRRVEINLIIEPTEKPTANKYSTNSEKYPMLNKDHKSNLNADIDPLLGPSDQLTFVQKPNWIKKSSITIAGEVARPGIYVVDRGETLCSVLKRAGGVTEDAYVFGAYFTRVTVKQMQQTTLNRIQDQLDDLMVDLSLSPRRKSQAYSGEERDEYLKVIKQLDQLEASGRMVIDLEEISECNKSARVVLENGDKLVVPTTPTYVNVAGQVYVPTSHMYRKDRRVGDYIELSGGHTVIGRLHDAFVVQANGEVMSYTGHRSSSAIVKAKVAPGAEIIVPLNLDRMTTNEHVQEWLKSIFSVALTAAVL